MLSQNFTDVWFEEGRGPRKEVNEAIVCVCVVGIRGH